MKQEFNPEAMDRAAQEFQAELDAILADGNKATDLCKLVNKYYLRAGHKRLGRIMAGIGK